MTEEATDEHYDLPARFVHVPFLDHLVDAAFQHRRAIEAEASYVANRCARASITACALSLESAANALLASLDERRALMEDLDKLGPIAKIDAFLRMRQRTGLDRGHQVVQRIAELVRARNDFVHPKISSVDARLSTARDGGHDWLLPFSISGENFPQLGIPRNAMFWSGGNSRTVLIAISAFFSHVFRDLLQAPDDEFTSMLLSRMEVGNIHMPAVYDEYRTELQALERDGIDFAFLRIALEVVPTPSVTPPRPGSPA